VIAVIFAYLTVVGRGRKVDFLTEYPVLIHVATLSGVASFIMYVNLNACAVRISTLSYQDVSVM